MVDHTVRAFGEALEGLRAGVIRMGDATARQIRDALEAYTRHDDALAKAVIERDRVLDAMEAEIERNAVRLIALRQPMAGDLRQALVAMKIASNLERVGDLARSIAWRSAAIEEAERNPQLTADAEAMWRSAATRIEDVMRAFAHQDVATATRIRNEDDLIDDQFLNLFEGLVGVMSTDPSSVQDCAHLLYVAKNLERIGDHATNIAKLVVYQVTGEEPRETAA